MLSFVHIRKLNYWVNIEKIDNCTQIPTALECEDNVKHLGVLLDSNLSWKFNFKIECCIKSKQNCWCCCPSKALRPTYYLFKYLSIFDIASSDIRFGGLGSSCQNPFTEKILGVLQKTSRSGVWCIFLNPEHTQCHYFIPQTFYPYKVLYVEKVFSIMLRVTSLISLLKLIESSSMRPGFLRREIIMSKLPDWIKIKVLFPVLELNFGTQFPKNFVNSPKELKKKTEDDYVEVPILLQKIAKSAATT